MNDLDREGQRLAAEYVRLHARAQQLYAARARRIADGVDPKEITEVRFPAQSEWLVDEPVSQTVLDATQLRTEAANCAVMGFDGQAKRLTDIADRMDPEGAK